MTNLTKSHINIFYLQYIHQKSNLNFFLLKWTNKKGRKEYIFFTCFLLIFTLFALGLFYGDKESVYGFKNKIIRTIILL